MPVATFAVGCPASMPGLRRVRERAFNPAWADARPQGDGRMNKSWKTTGPAARRSDVEQKGWAAPACCGGQGATRSKMRREGLTRHTPRAKTSGAPFPPAQARVQRLDATPVPPWQTWHVAAHTAPDASRCCCCRCRVAGGCGRRRGSCLRCCCNCRPAGLTPGLSACRSQITGFDLPNAQSTQSDLLGSAFGEGRSVAAHGP